MTESIEGVVPQGLADLPLEVRRARNIESDCELGEGLTRRYLADAEYAERYLAHHFDRLRSAAPAFNALMRRD